MSNIVYRLYDSQNKYVGTVTLLHDANKAKSKGFKVIEFLVK